MPANVLAAQMADNPEMKVHLSTTVVLSTLQKKLDHMQKVMFCCNFRFFHFLLEMFSYRCLCAFACVWMFFDANARSYSRITSSSSAILNLSSVLCF